MRHICKLASVALFPLAVPAMAADFTGIRFDYTGQFEMWTAPKQGYYSIAAWGASGGTGAYLNPGFIIDSVGGRGIGIADRVFLTKGQVLSIAVGGAGQGNRNTDSGGGGGGGSFIGRVGSNDPVVIAGGGGGGGWNIRQAASGGDAIFGPVPPIGSVCDNGNGQGGLGGADGAGGGGGWCGDGGSGIFAEGVGGEGGGGYLSARNLQGGAGSVYIGTGFPGGFGGGGGGALCAGGGGGGYAGGRGGSGFVCDGFGGGGGSSYASLSARILGYTPHGENGWVAISYVPEPDTWVLLIAGFGLTGTAMRRRRSSLAA